MPENAWRDAATWATDVDAGKEKDRLDAEAPRMRWLKALEAAEARLSMALEEARGNYHRVRGRDGRDDHDDDFDWLQRQVRSAISDIRNWNGDNIKF